MYHLLCLLPSGLFLVIYKSKLYTRFPVPTRAIRLILTTYGEVQHLRFSQRCCWELKPSGTWGRVVELVVPDVSKNCVACIFKGNQSMNNLHRYYTDRLGLKMKAQRYSETSRNTIPTTRRHVRCVLCGKVRCVETSCIESPSCSTREGNMEMRGGRGGVHLSQAFLGRRLGDTERERASSLIN